MAVNKKPGAAAGVAGPAIWLRRNLMAVSVSAVVVLGLGAVVWRAVAPSAGDSGAARSVGGSNVVVPALSPLATRGKSLFDANCATCHGVNAAGTAKGPPFLHDIYNPGHHGDAAFQRAARQGVPQHHWPFGNMPPQPRVSAAEVEAIVRYVREMQAANGIKYRPHRM